MTRASPSSKEGLKRHADAARTRVEAARAAVPAVDATFVVHGRDRRVGGNLLACAVAYRLFLWLLPFSLLVAALLGFLHTVERTSPSDAAEDLGLGAYVTSTVGEAAAQASQSWWVLLIIALVTLYSASAGAAKTLRTINAMVWGEMVERPRRPWRPALAFSGFAIGTLLLATAENWARSEAGTLGLLAQVAMMAGITALWLAASSLLPHGDAPWTRLLPGALLIAVGTQALHLVTVLYLAGKVTSSSELYGGFGAAAAVLLWLYLIGRLVVASAVLNVTLWDRSREGRPVLDAERRATEEPPVARGETVSPRA